MTGLMDWVHSLRQPSRFGMPMLAGSESMQAALSSRVDASANNAEAAVKAFKLQTLTDLQVM